MGNARTVLCLECGRWEKNRGRGLCCACHKRLRRAGVLQDRYPRVIQRPAYYLGQIDQSDLEACWPWPGQIKPTGYGYAGIAGYAHRWVYEQRVGPIPDGMVLDHECHNQDPACDGGFGCLHRRCVNPAHVAPKTNPENVDASPVVQRFRRRGV